MLPDDESLDAGEIIRAKWTMDGATTLAEAATQLRERADRLDELERDGWQLTGPVRDDYGWILRSHYPCTGTRVMESRSR